MERVITQKDSFVSAALYMSVVGPAVFIVQPGLVQAFVTHLGFSEQQAGVIAATEMWGIAFSTVVMIALAGRIRYHFILRAALSVMIVGNVVSSFLHGFEVFLMARLAVGVGSGVLVSLGFIIIGKSSNPDRNFGYLVMWVLLFGAVILSVMPKILNTFGMGGMLTVFTLMYLIMMPLVGRLPQTISQSNAPKMRDVLNVTGLGRVLLIIGVLIFFTGVGVIWTYLSLMGAQTGASEQNVAFVLTGSQLIGAGGALFAAIIGGRFGRFSPTLIALVLCMFPVVILLNPQHFILYIVAVCVFNFSYNFFHPFSYGILAVADSSAELIKFAVAAQMLGLAIGPSIAAMVVSGGGYDRVLLVSASLFVLTFLAFCVPVFQLASKRLLQA